MGKAEEFFRTRSVFTLTEFRTGVGRSAVAATVRGVLKYHLRRGRLKLLEKGVYATVPAGLTSARFVPDAFLVARALREDAVLAYHSALELLGLAHSTYRDAFYLTARRRKDLRLGSSRLRALLHPKPLRDKGEEGYGVEVCERQGVKLRVTGPERTLVDCLAVPRYAGGLEEALQSLGGVASLDLDHVAGYLERLGQRRLYAVVGYVLEREAERLFVPPGFLADLKRRRPTSPTYLDRTRTGGRFLPRWNLVVPSWATADERVEV